MIEVENITKHYGKHLALDDISFRAIYWDFWDRTVQENPRQ